MYVLWFSFFSVHISTQLIYPRAIQTLQDTYLCVFISWRNSFRSTDRSISARHTKDEGFLLKREPACAVVVVALFECVTLLFVVAQQREPSSHGTSSILFFFFSSSDHNTSGWEFGLAQLTVNDAVLAFLSLPSLRRKYNWEISRALSSSSKSFAYILCYFPHQSSA